ncbi:MAG TPA: ATP-binding protein [Acidimicrobiales bacterium]|nr:ATP-binding protein [Acidimicrobiales bacterium]
MPHGLSSFWDELVAAGDDVHHVLELIARRAAEVVGEASVLTTVSADGRTLEPAAVHHRDPEVREFMRAVLASEPYQVGEGVAGAVAARREPAVLSHIDVDELAAAGTPHTLRFLERHPLRALAVVPMVAFGDLVGTLGVVRTVSPAPYGDEDVMALEALAERAALALAETRRLPRSIGPTEYEAIFRHSLDGVLLTTPDGRVLGANPAACTILQLSEAEICRRGRSGLLPDDPSTKAAVGLRAARGSARAALPMRRGDGEVFIADITSTIFTTPDGELRASVIFRDVSDRVRSQTQLAKQRDLLALLHRATTAINEAPDLTAAIDRTLDAVGTAEDWPLGDALLLSEDGQLRPGGACHVADPERFGWFPDWMAPTALASGAGLAGRVVASARPAWVEDLLTATDIARVANPPPAPLRAYVGVPIMVGATARGVLELFSDEPRPRDDGVLSVLVDIATQLGRALERTEMDTAHQRLDEARAVFVARAAHELRTPVASLVMAVGALAARGLDDPKEQQLLDIVAGSTDHLQRLVTRLLDLSSLEHGGPDLAAEPVDVQRVVDHALATCPTPPGHTVTCHVPAGTTALADELSLGQILTNLIGNAHRHGGAHVQIDAWREGRRVAVAVSDDGPGVDPAIEGSLFEPFVRGPGRRDEGAGLGLAISSRLVQAMGGTLRYERPDGTGSRFVVELPAAA